MPVLATCGIQLSFLQQTGAGSRVQRPWRRAAHRRAFVRPGPVGPCPQCRGPMAWGEGYLTCVVCGYHRAA